VGPGRATARAAGALAGLAYGKVRGATIRRDLIDVAARTAPARPRAPHAAPARRLALRTRMDDPVHRRLRAARSSGLTSLSCNHNQPRPGHRIRKAETAAPTQPGRPGIPGRAAGPVSGEPVTPIASGIERSSEIRSSGVNSMNGTTMKPVCLQRRRSILAASS
jgi:hypothetical protein